MPEILLYNPPALPHPKPLMPVTLLSLGAVLEGHHPYRIFDGNTNAEAEAQIELAVNRGADILGITVMPGPQVKHALALSRRLKQTHPRLKIVWGGYFPTLYPEPCLGAGVVDALVLGFGDRTLPALVEAWRAGAGIAHIPGLAYPEERTGRILRTPPADVPDPNQLPVLPYQAIDMEASIRPTFMGHRTASYHSGYGCPFACSFCAVAATAQGCWRTQTPEVAIARIADLARAYRIDALEFWDNNFFGAESKTREFAEGLKPLRVRWWAQGRVDMLTAYGPETWQALKDSGLAMVFMGAEAATDEGLAHLGKGGKAKADKILQAAEIFKTYGVIPEFSFVLGYPPDPEANVTATLAYIRRVKRVNPAAEIVLNTFTPIDNPSALFAAAREWGFSFPRTLDEWVQDRWQEFAVRHHPRVPWMPDRLYRRIKNFERVLHAYYPTAAGPALGAFPKMLLRLLSGWRYHLHINAFPAELSLARRLIHYQRPDISGF